MTPVGGACYGPVKVCWPMLWFIFIWDAVSAILTFFDGADRTLPDRLAETATSSVHSGLCDLRTDCNMVSGYTFS